MKIVTVLSGGMDSTTLLYHLLSEGFQVRAFSVDYGQRHEKELEAAERIARRVGVDHELLQIPDLARVLQGSALTTEEISVPEGHYAEETMKATVVPNRNMILLSLAIGYAISSECEAVAYGAHSGDHAIYPDCRPPFADLMARAARLADWRPIQLLRPFIDYTKADIVVRGDELEVPWALTWSCYNGREKHCGVCGTCVERREAFQLAKVEDPTGYEQEPALPVSG